MNDVIHTIMTVCAFGAVAVLLLIIIGWYGFIAYKGLASFLRGLLHKRGGVGLIIVAVVAIIHGGTKNITNRFTADTGLTVVEATYDRATNEVDSTYLTVKWTGPDEDTPIYVRDSVHDSWAQLGNEWMFDWRSYENGTNTVYWWIDPGVAASNATIYAQWHLGSDLPPVEIDGDGVTIERFTATSKYVAIEYGVSAAALTGPGIVTIESAGESETWTERHRHNVTAPETNLVELTGFYVGETTRWRVRLEVDQ